jgi:hypothetical protein
VSEPSWKNMEEIHAHEFYTNKIMFHQKASSSFGLWIPGSLQNVQGKRDLIYSTTVWRNDNSSMGHGMLAKDESYVSGGTTEQGDYP